MNTMLKAFIIGCGRIAGIADTEKTAPVTHAAAYHSTSGVKLEVCMDVVYEKAIAFAERHGCKATKTIKEAVDNYLPEIISVCTPDATHFAVVKQLLNENHLPKVIFLEKPACSSLMELEELIRLADEKKVEIVVNHTRRFDQHHRELRKRILEGEFGSLYRAEAVYYSGWKHNGVHILDTLSFLFGDYLRIVRINGALNSPYENDPTLELELAFECSPGCIVINAMEEQFYQLFEFDLRFTEARLRIEDFGDRIILERKTINEIGENVIVLADHGLSKRTSTPMQNAIHLIVDRLTRDESKLLNGYTLADISSTMKTIWSAEYAYKNQTSSS